MNDTPDRPDDTAPVRGSGSRWEPSDPENNLESDPGSSPTPTDAAAREHPSAMAAEAPAPPAESGGGAREERRRTLRRGGIIGSAAAALLLIGGGAGFAIGHSTAEGGGSDIAELTGFDGDGDADGHPGRGERDGDSLGDRFGGHGHGPRGAIPPEGVERDRGELDQQRDQDGEAPPITGDATTDQT